MHTEVDLMAIESVTNTVTTYHEPAKSTQSVENVKSPKQSTSSANVVDTETVAHSTVKKGQQETEGFQQQKENQSNAQRIKSAIDQANKKQVHTRFEFSYHDETNRISIKVIDQETDKVIREIPPEDSLELLEKIWEIAGLIVDEKR